MSRNVVKLAVSVLASAIFAVSAAAQGFIRDAEIEETLREWTNPILEVAGLEPDHVGLYVIGDPSLNAFVAYGQNIHLHTGLLVAAENPGQIKGVIGHETCHIACGHTITRSRAANVAMRPALLSIGLGILAIAAGEGGAGAALISSSQQFAALNFFTHTRAEEGMADAAAVQYLTELGQNTNGIVEFFENYRYQEVLSQSRRNPYFRAHPLASDRIRNVRALVEQSGMKNVPPRERELRQFEMMQAKLIGFLETPNKVNRRYPPDDTSVAARYAHSIAALQASDITRALELVDSIIADEPDNPYFHELRGQILFEGGRAEESVEPHKRSLELKPGSPLLLINYARSLNTRNAPGDVEAAETALRDALIAEPQNAFAWAQLASTLEMQGRRAEAQLATAESAYAVGDIVRANSFAHRAAGGLERGTTLFRRADDILLITDPNNPDNRLYYERLRRDPRRGFQITADAR